MRVVSGIARGKRLLAPPATQTRPTSNRVREAIFNSLYSLGLPGGTAVLDLFAGTGALGIEALSRGASAATFVENDKQAVTSLKANLETLGLTDLATVVPGDALAALEALDRTSQHFGLALVDPPYGFKGWDLLLPKVPADVVVIESDRAIEVGGALSVHHRKRYGSTVVTFAVAAPSGPRLSGDRQ